jgi:hypothetical protein
MATFHLWPRACLPPAGIDFTGILKGLRALSTYDLIIGGHGEPTDRSALDATIAYLNEGKAAYAISREPDAYAGRMKAAFPERRHPGWIDLSASLLYRVVDAYDTGR